MAYKQKGCAPVTAKIKRTTQGGMVQQPLLNMGAPVKMKMTSPAKQTGDPFGATYQKKRAEKRLEKEKVSAQKDMAKYKEGMSQYKKDAKSIKSIPEYNRGSVEGRMSKFEKQYGTRMRGEEGRAADDAKRASKIKTKETVKPVQEVETKPVLVVETKPKQKMAKSGTASRKAQYDAKGWKYDETISGYNRAGKKIDLPQPNKPKKKKEDKPKAKLAETKAPKMPAKTVTIDTKAPSSKKEARQAKRAVNKNSREEIRAARKAYRKGDITKKQKKEAIASKKNSAAKKIKSC